MFITMVTTMTMICFGESGKANVTEGLLFMNLGQDYKGILAYFP